MNESPHSAEPAALPSATRRLPAIDGTRCTGCGWCVPTCEPRLLSLAVVAWKKTSVLSNPERCTGCSDCAVACPFRAIRMRKVIDATGIPND